MVIEALVIAPEGNGWGLARGLEALDVAPLNTEAPQPERTDVVARAAKPNRMLRREMVG
jgi:hypothetical protein